MAVRTLAQVGAIVGCLQLAAASPLSFGNFGFGFGSIRNHLGSEHGGGSKEKTSPASTSSKTSKTSSTTSAAHSTASVVINGDCENTASTRQCWGGGYYIGTDAETSWPTTGVTRSYVLEITNTTLAPDGTERPVFAINGQYPGPTIEAGKYTRHQKLSVELTGVQTGVIW